MPTHRLINLRLNLCFSTQHTKKTSHPCTRVKRPLLHYAAHKSAAQLCPLACCHNVSSLANLRIHTHAHMHTHTHAHTHMHTYTHAHIHTRTHTHIHTEGNTQNPCTRRAHTQHTHTSTHMHTHAHTAQVQHTEAHKGTHTCTHRCCTTLCASAMPVPAWCSQPQESSTANW